MAFLFMRAKIVKASSGRSVIAAAAYQAAEKLHDERLGMTFQYRHKEEVVHSEILLPANAPAAYEDRETLWNAVATKENKANSQVARAFIIAMPMEWSREESIDRAREFIQKNLVDVGMCVDWAFHMKDGNPHLHCLCTIRGFKKDGSWNAREKKEYALDGHGERIPEIDPETGMQRTRDKKKGGKIYQEKIWKRVTVQTNPWNSRQFLHGLKKSWVDYCNGYLQGESQIDYRSTHEGESNRVPLVHEGPETRAALERGVVFNSVKENQERRQINAALARIEKLILNAKWQLDQFRERLKKWRQLHEERRSTAAITVVGGYGEDSGRGHIPDARNDDGTGENRSITQIIKAAAELEQWAQKNYKHRHRR